MGLWGLGALRLRGAFRRQPRSGRLDQRTASHSDPPPPPPARPPLTRPSFVRSGPGTYTNKSGVGVQVSSKCHTQPIYGFGSAGRDHVQKQFLSEEHNKSRFGVDSPGPSMYSLRGSIGSQEHSRCANQPAWVFGGYDRFKYDHVRRSDTSPGPGTYSVSHSVGPQVASTKASSPVPGFGTSNREHMGKLYISPEHEKSNCGNNSPGPCNYNLPEATGKQPLSKYSSMPSWGFGSSKRWDTLKKSSDSTPGPGSYCV